MTSWKVGLLIGSFVCLSAACVGIVFGTISAATGDPWVTRSILVGALLVFAAGMVLGVKAFEKEDENA